MTVRPCEQPLVVRPARPQDVPVILELIRELAEYERARDGGSRSTGPVTTTPTQRAGHTAGSPEDALDTACGLYLNDPTAWIEPPKSKRSASRASTRYCATASRVPR